MVEIVSLTGLYTLTVHNFDTLLSKEWQATRLLDWERGDSELAAVFYQTISPTCFSTAVPQGKCLRHHSWSWALEPSEQWKWLPQQIGRTTTQYAPPSGPTWGCLNTANEALSAGTDFAMLTQCDYNEEGMLRTLSIRERANWQVIPKTWVFASLLKWS